MKKKSIAEKAREAGLDPKIVYNRTSRGMTLAEALKKPVKKRAKKPKKKFSQAVEHSMPQVKIPEGLGKPSKVDDAESGFVLFLSVMLLGFAVAGLLWLVLK